MTLGEKICSLRMAQGLSQSDLAETLEVSRQSVSKWETDASVPDLDRLVRMSRLFGVSLDELVLGETKEEETKEAAAEPSAEQHTVPPVPSVPPRHTQTAVILFCAAGVVALLGLLVAGVLGLVLAVPFLLCGCIVLMSRRHPGLWCTWAVLQIVMRYLQFGTGIQWGIVFLTFQYEPSWNYMRLLMGWGFVLVSLGLMLGTAWRLRKETWSHRIPEKAVVLGGIACLAVGKIAVRLYWVELLQKLEGNSDFLMQRVLTLGLDFLHLLLLTVLAVSLARWRYRRQMKKKAL